MRSRLEALLKQLHVAGAIRREGTRWSATGQELVYDNAKYQAGMRKFWNTAMKVQSGT